MLAEGQDNPWQTLIDIFSMGALDCEASCAGVESLCYMDSHKSRPFLQAPSVRVRASNRASEPFVNCKASCSSRQDTSCVRWKCSLLLITCTMLCLQAAYQKAQGGCTGWYRGSGGRGPMGGGDRQWPACAWQRHRAPMWGRLTQTSRRTSPSCPAYFELPAMQTHRFASLDRKKHYAVRHG